MNRPRVAPQAVKTRLDIVASMPWEPVWVFLVGLGMAAGAAFWQYKKINADAEVQFGHRVQSVTDHVRARLQRPLDGLQGVMGVYAASQKVQRAEFRAYVESRNVAREFVGVGGFGFVQHVQRPGLAAFIAAERADGAPQFALSQLTDHRHDDLYVIKFIEPAANNAGALGLDIGSEANRRAAAQRAVDTGEPTMTAAIALAQEQRKTPGVLMFVPVYANGGHPATVAQRRAALVGLVYAPLVMDEVLGGMSDERAGLIDFELFDGPALPTGASGGTVLYDNDRHTATGTESSAPQQGAVAGRRFSSSQTLTLAGRDMTLRVNSTPALDAGFDHATPWLLLIGGTLLSALLALLLRQEALGRLRAEARAREITSALRESEFRWRFAIDGAGDGLWDWNVPQSTVFFSTRWKEMLGFSEDEIGNALNEWSQRVHPEDLVRVMAEVNAHLGGVTPTYVSEHRVVCKDGSFKWILDRGLVVERDAAGKPLRMIGTHTDISARKQTEMALLRSEIAARRAEDTSRTHLDALKLQKFALDQHAIVAVTDVQGKITYVNEKFCKISGYSEVELIGQDHILLNSGTHPHGFFKAMYRTVGAGKSWREEVCNRAKDGQLYWVDTTIVPVMNSAGQPEQYLSIRSDITLRKQVELDLVQQQLNLEMRVQQKTKAAVLSEQHLRLVMNTSLDSIIGMDARGCITEWSRQAETTFGWSFAEVQGQALHDFIIPERYREAHQKGLANYLATGRGSVLGKRIEIFALRRDGTEFPVELAISPIVTLQGTTFSAFISDVTVRKREQAALVAAKALAESASRAKSEFLANMSHEIRTPMNGIIGMIDILQDTPLLPEQQRMLGTVQQSSLALLQILNDILDFSKVEAGKLTVESIPTDLQAVAGAAVQLIASVSHGKALKLSVDVDPGFPGWTLSDPARLRQVLLNLLGNAVKFSAPARGQVTQVALRLTPCVLGDGRAGVRLCVQDNGVGIAPEVAAKLFQPFTQADESTARKFGGTGLGLSICQRLVELMGGTLSVRSTLGEGAEFIVQLPLLHCEPGHTQPVPHMPACTPTERRVTERCAAPTLEQAMQAGCLILLAEDNETNRDVMQEQLRLLGHACEVAEDGAIALKMWQAHPTRYALLLSDCHMPHLDGFGLTEAIRTCEPAGTRLPIIAVTANAMQGEAERCRERGMDDYLSKPLRMSELAPMLAKWLPAPVVASPARQSMATEVRTASVPLWNPATLTELVGDNPALHQRLLEKFLTNAEKQVAEIAAAAAASDTATLAGVAHTLKSAARSVGVLRLGALCQSLETAGRADDGPGCSELVQGLAGEFAAATAEINGHLGR